MNCPSCSGNGYKNDETCLRCDGEGWLCDVCEEPLVSCSCGDEWETVYSHPEDMWTELGGEG